jgi:hypothetical protein
MKQVKCEIKLSKAYNSFGYSVEGSINELDALRYLVMLKTLEFMDEFDKLKALRDIDRLAYVRMKLEEIGFGRWLDASGWHVGDDSD